jgi:hypothetical protein
MFAPLLAHYSLLIADIGACCKSLGSVSLEGLLLPQPAIRTVLLAYESLGILLKATGTASVSESSRKIAMSLSRVKLSNLGWTLSSDTLKSWPRVLSCSPVRTTIMAALAPSTHEAAVRTVRGAMREPVHLNELPELKSFDEDMPTA